MFKRLMQQVDRMLGRGVIDEQLYEELEEALLQTDASVTVTHQILAELRRAVREEKITEPGDMKARLQKAIADRFRHEAAGVEVNDVPPTVYLFVGVNGVGKTTTIAKLAYLLKRKGFSVLMAAGDTFRAAAIEQIDIWAQRIGVEIVKSQPGSDSASVIFDAITAAKARGIDFVLCDTAGRQHSKGNLMAELGKVAKVAEKGLGRKPDEILLILDANTGQNAIRQAEEFVKHAGVTGLVLTKLDGTSRGGAMLGVYEQFRLPIKFIGVGEKMEDLKDFKPDQFAAQLFE
ncbi:MAG: signal recognition particle-docking protein FtsY [Fimbriimonadaceae bacterium]|nr:signal recognition particle-docking protein FtsY [Fimbriimonadaceae bacterium]